jgi:uroporphyrinogen-III synthase
LQSAVEKKAWQDKPVYVVGPRTADAVRELGLTPIGAETGNAEALAQHIVQQHFEAPLLFLCGSRRRDVIPKQLQAAGTVFAELCVYETHLRTDLELPPPASIAWMVFYSPSGVEAMQQIGYDASSIRKAAIGPTTAEALEEAVWQVDAIAQEPTPGALVAAIRKAMLS